ncbi:MAG TPA: nitroreductase family protein [Bacteroidales bacterium]|jgi:nitroreductase|nr:nitroreductase family protein [Bacteroidales bacterium]NLS45775.1 NADPH-dependent oxidoreductase [Bacillota bacterium]MCK9498164.1 nitroreductase family protein [Bacteroidales bacterium]MDY0313483.1 nitroreductase family protein [Bacteroidales bacterium]HOE38263.1 nitroreductase family protein [Bacteroidales bacterium]
MLKEIFEHRSIRKYLDKAIPKEVMDEVLQAAIRASNTGNMQIYSIIVTSEKSLKQALAPAHFNQAMLSEAPTILTFCADFNRFQKWCDLRNANYAYDNILAFITASVDAIIAAQNACVEARHHGLGICYLGTALYNPDKIISVLNLPKGVVPVTAITIGYPAENPPLTDRLPSEAVVHYETYKDFSEEDINRIYSEKEEREDSKQFIKENNKETLAQVFTDIRYKKSDFEHFSKILIDTLKNQGFLK